jgi:hypothetical protein
MSRRQFDLFVPAAPDAVGPGTFHLAIRRIDEVYGGDAAQN